MSQDGKKPKLLSTKRAPKTKISHPAVKDVEEVSSSTNLNSLLTFSSMNNEVSKDDSLFNIGSSLKHSFPVESEDVFEFPDKSNTCVVNCNVNSEVKTKSVLVETQCSDQNISLNDSSVLFQSNICENNHLTSKNNGLKNEVDESVAKSESLKPDVEKTPGESKKQCPVCLRLLTSDKYVNHMKSCAAKNNLSTQTLLDALKLQQKQQLERKELGLDVPVQSYRAKGSPRRHRASERKGPADANLQLALALSASLRSAEEKELIEEAEVLNSVGLSEEAREKLGTLERFGFAALQPPQSSTGIGKNRPVAPTLLLKRSKEERDRIVTEKVAIVLISEEENAHLGSLNYKEPSLNSRMLKKVWNKENRLWKKAQRVDLEERSIFYVADFSEVVSVAEFVVDTNVQTHSKNNENSTISDCLQVEGDIFELETPPRSLILGLNSSVDPSICGSSANSTKYVKMLGNAWRNMVNNSEMSDVKVICKEGKEIFSHKIVFYVRCPKVLNTIVSKSDKGKEELNFTDFNYCSTLAFLDFLYCGNVETILSMSDEDFTELGCIVERFDNTELKNILNDLEHSKRKSVVKRKLSIEQFTDDNQLSEINKSADLKKHSMIGKEECGFISCEERSRSPDMFDVEISRYEFRVMERESATQSELDCLVSLIGKTPKTCESITDSYKHETSVDVLSNSKSDVLKKRKASTCSEDEETSMTKKHRLNESKEVLSDKFEDSYVSYDLTQSSASNEEHLFKNDFEENKFESKQSSPSGTDDLTQRSPTLDNERNKEDCESFNESQSKNLSICNNYINPIWDNLDDDYHYYSNYSPVTSPKSSAVKASNKQSSDTDIKTVPENCDPYKSIPSFNHSRFKTSADGNILDQSSFTVNERNNPEYVLSSDSDIEFESNGKSCDKPNTLDCTKSKNTAPTNVRNVSILNSSSTDLTTPTRNPPTDSNFVAALDKEDNQLKFPVQQDSLAQQLLNDSFEISDTAFATADIVKAPSSSTDGLHSLAHCDFTIKRKNNTGLENLVATPSPKLLVSDNVTPLPNYSGMKTPALKKELSKFGLKPSLGKKKAKLLLRYIYDETHPLVPDIQQASQSKTKNVFKTSTEISDKRVDSDSEISSSQRSESSSGSSSTDAIENCLTETLTQEPPASEDMRSVIRNFITKDPDLHHKVLMYEPIFLEDLMNRLKSEGKKCNMKTIMDYLDEQCITFRTNSWKATNERRKQKISKKKRKIEDTAQLS